MSLFVRTFRNKTEKLPLPPDMLNMLLSVMSPLIWVFLLEVLLGKVSMEVDFRDINYAESDLVI